MSEEDIGRAIARRRGPISQKRLAEAMRARGWRWSQNTVWSIEQGERPLRLAEAHDLALILGVPNADWFATAPAGAATSRALKALVRRREQLVDAIGSFLDAQLALAQAGDSSVLDDEEREALLAALRYGPDAIAAAVIAARDQQSSQGEDGSFVAALHAQEPLLARVVVAGQAASWDGLLEIVRSSNETNDGERQETS